METTKLEVDKRIIVGDQVTASFRYTLRALDCVAQGRVTYVSPDGSWLKISGSERYSGSSLTFDIHGESRWAAKWVRKI